MANLGGGGGMHDVGGDMPNLGGGGLPDLEEGGGEGLSDFGEGGQPTGLERCARTLKAKGIQKLQTKNKEN